MRLALLEGHYAVCRLADDAEVPVPPAAGDGFWSLTHAGAERSLVCPQDDAPADATVVDGWRILQVDGPLDLGLTGVLAELAAPLAAAGVPIFPIATHDTDWILVPGAQLGQAIDALRADGHDIAGEISPGAAGARDAR